ncbi:MAG: hypothetical protein ACI87E_001606 [Mariniblastus sp.]|jgi:hypothetical protein
MEAEFVISLAASAMIVRFTMQGKQPPVLSLGSIMVNRISQSRIPQPPQLNLARGRFDRPLFVDMESFFDFSFWMSEELLDLESRFKSRSQTRIPRKQAQAVV